MNKVFATWQSVAKQWLSGTTIECAVALRWGVVAGFIVVLAVLQFRPETTAQECAVFGFVPLGVFVTGTRVTASLLSYLTYYLKTPPKPVEIDVRLKCVAWGVVLCVFVLIVGIPSTAIFQWLGMAWAAEFMNRFTVVLLAAIIAAATLIGSKILDAFRVLPGLISGLGTSSKEKFVKCLTH